jgi:hypothetical protein
VLLLKNVRFDYVYINNFAIWKTSEKRLVFALSSLAKIAITLVIVLSEFF